MSDVEDEMTRKVQAFISSIRAGRTCYRTQHGYGSASPIPRPRLHDSSAIYSAIRAVYGLDAQFVNGVDKLSGPTPAGRLTAGLNSRYSSGI